MPCSFTAFFLPFSNHTEKFYDTRFPVVLSVKPPCIFNRRHWDSLNLDLLKKTESFCPLSAYGVSRSDRRRHKVRCCINNLFTRTLFVTPSPQKLLSRHFCVSAEENREKHLETEHSALIFGGIVEVNMLQITFTIFKLKSLTNWRMETWFRKKLSPSRIRRNSGRRSADASFIVTSFQIKIVVQKLLNRNRLVPEGIN